MINPATGEVIARDESTLVGPMIPRSQYETAVEYFDIASKEACVVLAGGEKLKLPGALANGLWLQPTILSGVKPGMKVHDDEIFGPILSITCFSDEAEAEILARAGFDDVLIANQVVGKHKLERLMKVAGTIKLGVALDHRDQFRDISDVADRAGVTLGIPIEVDIGMGRCGVAPGESALELVRQVVDRPGLRFDGLQAFEGHLVYIENKEERQRLTLEAMQRVIRTRRLIADSGISVGAISGGSSSTYSFIADLEGTDEVQAVTYATMDCVYRHVAPEFEQSLSILTRVISRARPKAAVLDVGVKGVGHEFGVPEIKGYPEIEIPFFKYEEHCMICKAPDWSIGQTLELIPSHACTTCNLYRPFHVHEKGRIIDVWPMKHPGC
ncbi:MAG TPA: aldehyde dehydrogenase family protein [Verrucomicrobiales bacterium]|nr:aldehyde dehydrogenase family protein [Verrucomicrobiales bacterium]